MLLLGAGAKKRNCFMKELIRFSALVTVILFAGCGRSPQKESKADGAGSDQLT
jgi:hypothetical protein